MNENKDNRPNGNRPDRNGPGNQGPNKNRQTILAFLICLLAVSYTHLGSESALTETFVKDNNVEEMTDVLEMTVPGEDVTVKDKILPGFVDNSITNPYGDGKTYLMPMFYGPGGLFYNKGLFEEKGWEVPETWDEMWELGEKAKEDDIALFTYPTAGYFDAFFYDLLHETAGAETFQDCLLYTSRCV